MKVKQFFTKLHYKKRYSWIEILLIPFLFILSYFYNLIVRLRAYLYEINFLNSYKSDIKVISIGNLTTGGTGKTPIVASILTYLDKNTDYKCSVLTRGYGRQCKDSQDPFVLPNETMESDPKIFGDEPILLSKTSADAKVYVSSNRVKSAKIAEEKSDLILLDDGYQHLRLNRDLNILIIDAEKQFGNNQMLPLGPLREPISSLKRADIFIINNKDNDIIDSNLFIEKYLAKYNKPILFAKYEIECFIDLKTNQEYKHINYSNIAAFCGIGQPKHFFNQLLNLDFNVVEQIAFDDHHYYTLDEVLKIAAKVRSNKAEAIITTEKDAVKLTQYISKIDLPIYSLKIYMKLDVKKILEFGGLK